MLRTAFSASRTWWPCPTAGMPIDRYIDIWYSVTRLTLPLMRSTELATDMCGQKPHSHFKAKANLQYGFSVNAYGDVSSESTGLANLCCRVVLHMAFIYKFYRMNWHDCCRKFTFGWTIAFPLATRRSVSPFWSCSENVSRITLSCLTDLSWWSTLIAFKISRPQPSRFFFLCVHLNVVLTAARHLVHVL